MINNLQVHKIENDIVTGYFVISDKYPSRDDYFVTTGEIKFGGMYQDVGHFDDDAFRFAQSFYFIAMQEKTVIIDKNIPIMVGHVIRVESINLQDKCVKFKRFDTFKINHIPKPLEIINKK